MQKPDEKLLAAVRSLSIAERTYLACFIDILASTEDDKPKRGRPRNKTVTRFDDKGNAQEELRG